MVRTGARMALRNDAMVQIKGDVAVHSHLTRRVHTKSVGVRRHAKRGIYDNGYESLPMMVASIKVSIAFLFVRLFI